MKFTNTIAKAAGLCTPYHCFMVTLLLLPRHLTSVQHIAGSKDSNNQSKEFIFKKWAEYLGSENVALKKYNVLLSYPKTSGKVSIVDALSGKTLFVSQANETRLYKDEFVPNVAVPFNAYSAAKNVKVFILTYWQFIYHCRPL